MAHRRGRRSWDDYVESVVPLIRADVWKLKDERIFAEYPGIRTLVSQFEGEAWSMGLALHVLIAAAVADVYAVATTTRTRHAQRTAEFLRLWYYRQQTVSAIAADMHLSRSHVAKAIQRPSLLLVAQRFLALAQYVDPNVQSEGLRCMLSTYGSHRSRAVAQ